LINKYDYDELDRRSLTIATQRTATTVAQATTTIKLTVTASAPTRTTSSMN
jgi:hypothetical protein